MAKKFIFTYRWCRDIDEIKAFYSDILGLDMIWDEPGMIAYKIQDHQLSFELDESLEKNNPTFAKQPGWEGGKNCRTSWSLQCDRKEFDQILSRAQAAKIPSFLPEPQWVGYWSYVLLDPMNETLEITCSEE